MITIEQVREVLKIEDGWFEPKMKSKQYVLDIKLTHYPSIEVRVITGIPKDGQASEWASAKILAIKFNGNDKVLGWIKSTEIYLGDYGWQKELLTASRKMWKRAVARAKKERVLRETVINV